MPQPRILIVEDNALNRDLVIRNLKNCGLEFLQAPDGPSGVQMALADKPDLILMDLHLPHPDDGLKATREIRSWLDRAHLPIIAFSADLEQRDRALEAGCNDFVKKPVLDYKKDLLPRIQHHLKSRTFS